MNNLFGKLVLTESGEYEHQLPADQISRRGKANPKLIDLLAEQQTLANITKDLKKDVEKNTKKQILKKSYVGRRRDVNFRLHRDLAKLRCECNTNVDLVFVEATIMELNSSLLKKTYKVGVTYSCPSCKKTFSAEGIFTDSWIPFL